MASMIINNNVQVGRSIVISNGKIIIDGKDVTPEGKTINISIEGDVDNISVDMCNKFEVKGNVNSIVSTSGDIECGDVTGNIECTSGDIECNNVGGNVETTSGDVKCGNVGGNVKTMSGDIKHRKL